MVSKDKEQLVVLTMDNHLTSVITEIATNYLRNVLGCHYEYSRHPIGLVMRRFSMNVKSYQKCKTDFCFYVVYGRAFQTNIGRFKSKEIIWMH